MRTGTGIFLLTAGAILLFALRSGSPHWLNLQIVGVILILAGGLGLLLPRLARSRPDRRLAATAGSAPGSPKTSASRSSRPTRASATSRRRPPTTAPRRWPTTSSATSRTTEPSAFRRLPPQIYDAAAVLTHL